MEGVWFKRFKRKHSSYAFLQGHVSEQSSQLHGGIKKNSEHLTVFWKKKKNHAKRAFDQEILIDLWCPVPELHLWHQGYSSVSSERCSWPDQLLLPSRLMGFAALVCRSRENRMIICRFPESVLDSSLSLSHEETFQGTQCKNSWMAVHSLWHIHLFRDVGASPVWKGQGQPLFLLMGWRLFACARNKLSYSVEDDSLY